MNDDALDDQFGHADDNGACAGLATMSAPPCDAAMLEIAAFGANPGALRMMLCAPSPIAPGAALVVVLHGAGQSAQAYAEGAGWLSLANRFGFIVVSPEQTRANNPFGCFNWFEVADASRLGGEAESIAAVIGHVRATHSIDPARIYITGLSAGGAMAAVMLATYPELFAAGAIIAGLPYGAATSPWQAMTAMASGSRLTDAALGDLVRAASPNAGPWPKIAIWHGDDDVTVTPGSAGDLARQWADVHGAVTMAMDDRTETGRRADFWRAPCGGVAVERHRIAGMAHGAALKTGVADGCGVAGPHLIDIGVSSTAEIACGWGLVTPSPSCSAADNEEHAPACGV